MNQLTQQDGVVAVLKETVTPFKENIAILMGGCCLMLYVPFLVIGIPVGIVAFLVALMAGDSKIFIFIPLTIVAMVLFAAGYNLFRVGWTRILLKIVDGQRASIADMREAMPWFVNFLLCCTLIGLATGLGTCFLIVPGIYVAVRTAFAPFLVIDEGLGPIEACIKSNDMVTGYAWQICLWGVIYGLTNMIASYVPFVGLALTPAVTAFFDLTLAKIYRTRTGLLG
ncbi:MAG: hypothetical protein K2W95_09425 [Candidatus Obscuribacterales bacterium]|nr:hypothetical protein [Candidatus Obscuribacterales bacterium]